tara:strand:+ start:65 stop:1456 length:1392 start_codon:yes stop_codon:yes gene_type:complete
MESQNFTVPEGKANSLKNKENGFSDPSGVFPKVEYEEISSVNEIARGFKRVNVELGGSVKDINFDLNEESVSTYPNSQVKETASGHIVEYDDTPGSERVMIRHNSGSGVEMRADGSVVYSSTKNTVRVTAEDEKVVVDGDGELQYNGNLKLKVAGDFDVEVGGDFNVNVKGDMEQNIRRGLITDVAGTVETQIVGSKSETIGGGFTTLIHGDKNDIIKGSFAENVQVDHNYAAGGTLTMTAEKEVTLSTKSANITASSLAVLGDSGTIGGNNMVYYGHTAHIPRVNSTSVHATAMYATTFHGSLNGTAKEAIDANKAATAALGAASPGGYSTTVNNTLAADSNTVPPTTSIINDALENSGVAIKRVHVDDFNQLFNRLDRTAHYGGVSKVDLNTKEARSKLRDPNNASNSTFISALIADGTISPFATRLSPLSTGRIVGKDTVARRGTDTLGRSQNSTKLYKA